MAETRVALVTGASSGIGAAIAERLLADGLVVYGAARRVEKMEPLQAKGAKTLKMDITKEEEVAAVIRTIEEQDGGVDVLVNNAGFGMYGAMEDTSIEDARYQFEVNLFGLARVTKGVLPGMRQKGAGRIINISSVGGKIYTPLGSWYHATKHALEGWSDCLRLELKAFGIHVVVVEPGLIDTEFGDTMLGPMMERSGSGPYAELAGKLEKATRASYKEGAASPPSVIAKAISKAVRARKPKIRYVAGKYARPLLFLRKWFGDRLFDAAVMSQVK